MTENAERDEHLRNSAGEVADHLYEVSDYEGTTQVTQGTAETHEQVSDAYMASGDPEDLSSK